jgi:hypothetical protein
MLKTNRLRQGLIASGAIPRDMKKPAQVIQSRLGESH